MAEIPSTPADGNTKVVFVPTLADAAAPKVAELTGASAIDLSCYLTGSGLSPSIKEDVVTDERLCSTQTYEQPEAVVRWHYEKPERLRDFEAMVLEQNVVDWILARARVTDQPMTFEQVMDPGQGAQPARAVNQGQGA